MNESNQRSGRFGRSKMARRAARYRTRKAIIIIRHVRFYKGLSDQTNQETMLLGSILNCVYYYRYQSFRAERTIPKSNSKRNFRR